MLITPWILAPFPDSEHDKLWDPALFVAFAPFPVWSKLILQAVIAALA